MRRVIVYIDGFNLYHAIDELKRPHLKWVDLQLLSERLLRSGESLVTVKYFSAYATWLKQPHLRHRAYTSVLESNGVERHMGQFKEKPRRCSHCGATWTAHEEKEADVQIAVHMIADALAGDVDRLILISADTDLVPPIKMIARKAPHCEVFVAAPPRRMGRCRSLGPKIEITPGRLAKCLLPANSTLAMGANVIRPPQYDPPAT